MTNVCMKFEKAGPNQTLVIDQTRLYTTDGLADSCTAISSRAEEGGGIVIAFISALLFGLTEASS